MIKVAIVDDDALIRESLKIILSTDNELEVIDIGVNGEDAIRISNENSIDIMLLDMRMPVMDGIEALKEIGFKQKVLVLTTFEEDYYLSESIKLGARGYILKNSTPQLIIKSIKDAASWNIVFNENTQKILKEALKNTREGNIKNDNLTERETEIIKEIANGLSNKQIAEKLFISEGTVKNYISSILTKTNLEHRTQIAISYLKGEL